MMPDDTDRRSPDAAAGNPHPWDGKGTDALRKLGCDEARQAGMRDGDLLLWHGHFAVSRFFEAVSGGHMSHAAIVADWDGTPMLLQAEFPYIQAVPLRETVRKYPGKVYWYSLADSYRSGIDVAKVLAEARSFLGADFSIYSVFRDLMHRRFAWPLPKVGADPKAMFCSELVAHCFRSGGMPLVATHDDVDTLPWDIARSPNLVFQALLHHY